MTGAIVRLASSIVRDFLTERVAIVKYDARIIHIFSSYFVVWKTDDIKQLREFLALSNNIPLDILLPA